MRACGGNHQFYKSLLLDLAERCRHSARELETAISHGDFGTIRFVTHTLHGVAANLGAEELARQCHNLEEKSQSASPAEVSTLVAYLQWLAETLSEELASTEPDLPPEEWTHKRIKDTRNAMSALTHLLSSGQGESLDSVQTLISLATPLAGQMGRLERMVNQFNFSGALEELGRLEAQIPVNLRGFS